jgi:hypothetical protein
LYWQRNGRAFDAGRKSKHAVLQHNKRAGVFTIETSFAWIGSTWRIGYGTARYRRPWAAAALLRTGRDHPRDMIYGPRAVVLLAGGIGFHVDHFRLGHPAIGTSAVLMYVVQYLAPTRATDHH